MEQSSQTGVKPPRRSLSELICKVPHNGFDVLTKLGLSNPSIVVVVSAVVTSAPAFSETRRVF